jgi:hypothetical protein
VAKDHRDFEAEKARWVLQTFLSTADQNYILARWAVLNYLHLDFFWMGLHAVEKYFKAILLLNGKSAANQKHDIERLSRDVLSLHPKLSWGEFQKPPSMGPGWRKEDASSYIARLNRRGNPDNRYLTYGYYFQMEDLVKLDQLAWQVRRHCRPLIKKDGIDSVKELKLKPQEWRLGEWLPLEKALNEEATLEQSAAARILNQAFAPSAEHDFSSWGLAAANAPLVHWYETLNNRDAPPEYRALAKTMLDWAIHHIAFARKDKKLICSALKKYTAGRSASL